MTGTGVSAVTAYTAHREWASRPPDERFASVHALYDAASARRHRRTDGSFSTAQPPRDLGPLTLVLPVRVTRMALSIPT